MVLPDGVWLTGTGLLLLPLVPTGREVTLGVTIQGGFLGVGCRVPSSKMPKAPGTGLPCSVEQMGKYVAKRPLGLCSWACVLPVRLHLGVFKGRGGLCG